MEITTLETVNSINQTDKLIIIRNDNSKYEMLLSEVSSFGSNPTTSYIGVWEPNKELNRGDIISYNDALFVVNTNFTSNSEFDDTNLTVLIDTSDLISKVDQNTSNISSLSTSLNLTKEQLSTTIEINDKQDSDISKNTSNIAILNTNLSDIGGKSTMPFVILGMGQSNMVGRDDAGDKTIQNGIYCTNDMLHPTALETAAYGTAPLNTMKANSGTTTDPALSCSNQAVSFANQIRINKIIPDDRDIIIVFSCKGGETITNWMGNGTSSDYWVGLLAGLDLVKQKYGDFEINHVLWDQGEADANAGGTAYNTCSLYLGAFDTLYKQLQALEQWTSTTTLSVTELGMFQDNSQQDRNDALRQLADGNIYPFVTFVTTSGFAESTEAAPFHYEGNAVQKIGVRHFQAYLEGRIKGCYTDSKTTWSGGARVIPDRLVTDGTNTLRVSSDNLLSGKCVIDATLGGTIQIIDPRIQSYTNFGEIIILNGSNSLTVRSGNNIEQEDGTQVNYINPLPNSIIKLYVKPDITRWKVESLYPRLGNSLPTTGTLSGTITLTEPQVRNGTYVVSGTPTSITLPAPANCPNNGHEITLYGANPATILVDGGLLFYRPMGITTYPSSFTLQNFQIVKLKIIKNHWWILEDSMQNTRATVQVSPSNGSNVTCNDSVAELTMIISPSADISSLQITPSSIIEDGSVVNFTFDHAVSTITWNNGFSGIGLPTSISAHGYCSVVYSSTTQKWYRKS